MASEALDGLRRARTVRTAVAALTMVLGPLACVRQPFIGDYENDPLDEARWQIDRRGDCRIAIVADPVRAGERALQVTAGPKARCELVPWVGTTIFGRQQREPFGEDRWYGFSVRVPTSYQPSLDTVVVQWHASPDPVLDAGLVPPLALRIWGAAWVVTYAYDPFPVNLRDQQHRAALWQEALQLDVWVDWVFHVRWSPGDDGLTEVWRNGEPIARRTGPNCFNDLRGVYLKLGVYHPDEVTTVYHDELRIGGAGASYATVAPPGPRPRR